MLLYEVRCKGLDTSWNTFLRRLEIQLNVIVDRMSMDLFSNFYKTKVKGAPAEVEKVKM